MDKGLKCGSSVDKVWLKSGLSVGYSVDKGLKYRAMAKLSAGILIL